MLMLCSLYDHLESMEFGLKEQTMLRNTILKISDNIEPHLAFKKFCGDIEGQYDAKRGLQKKIEEMNTLLIHARQDLYGKLRELFDQGFHRVILYIGTVLHK